MSDVIHPKVQLEEKENLESFFLDEQLQWNTKIKDLNTKMKNIPTIAELMTELYTERQIAIEYYHYLISLLIGINKNYNAKYSERYNYYTNVSQVRYPNDTAKHNRILVDLADIVEKKSRFENHSKYMLQTVNTLDNMIYAIPKRVEIEQILRGK